MLRKILTFGSLSQVRVQIEGRGFRFLITLRTLEEWFAKRNFTIMVAEKHI
jgi:hypothetical protein